MRWSQQPLTIHFDEHTQHHITEFRHAAFHGCGSAWSLGHLPMRIALIIFAGVALALFAFCEVGMAYPVAWWLYLFVAVAFAAALIRPVPARTQPVRIGALVAVLAIIAVLYFVEWTTRKPFLHDLARVHTGMTE